MIVCLALSGPDHDVLGLQVGVHYVMTVDQGQRLCYFQHYLSELSRVASHLWHQLAVLDPEYALALECLALQIEQTVP